MLPLSHIKLTRQYADEAVPPVIEVNGADGFAKVNSILRELSFAIDDEAAQFAYLAEIRWTDGTTVIFPFSLKSYLVERHDLAADLVEITCFRAGIRPHFMDPEVFDNLHGSLAEDCCVVARRLIGGGYDMDTTRLQNEPSSRTPDAQSPTPGMVH